MVICNVTVILKCDSIVWVRQCGFHRVMVMVMVRWMLWVTTKWSWL